MKRLSLLLILLCTEIVIEQLSVKKKYKLDTFELIGDGTLNITSFLISGNLNCDNNNCEIIMVWKERFSNNYEKKLKIPNLDDLVVGLNQLSNHDFG